jgi:hypothetical protein
MYFLSGRTKASFYGDSQMTFLVHKGHVDIVFKIKRGVYLTVEVHQLSEGRLLLACAWGDFFERLKQMRNREEVMRKLKKSCPRCANIFTNTVAPHFSYLEDSKDGYVVKEIKAPKQTNRINDFIEQEVIDAAMELMKYNLELQVEIEEKCPFAQWKRDLEILNDSK